MIIPVFLFVFFFKKVHDWRLGFEVEIKSLVLTVFVRLEVIYFSLLEKIERHNREVVSLPFKISQGLLMSLVVAPEYNSHYPRNF